MTNFKCIKIRVLMSFENTSVKLKKTLTFANLYHSRGGYIVVLRKTKEYSFNEHVLGTTIKYVKMEILFNTFTVRMMRNDNAIKYDLIETPYHFKNDNIEVVADVNGTYLMFQFIKGGFIKFGHQSDNKIYVEINTGQEIIHMDKSIGSFAKHQGCIMA